jgi:hypothetical protein
MISAHAPVFPATFAETPTSYSSRSKMQIRLAGIYELQWEHPRRWQLQRNGLQRILEQRIERRPHFVLRQWDGLQIGARNRRSRLLVIGGEKDLELLVYGAETAGEKFRRRIVASELYRGKFPESSWGAPGTGSP